MSKEIKSYESLTIAVIGLGYVGLPLAVAFSKKKIKQNKYLFQKVIGLDLNKERIQELKKGFDKTKEVTQEDLDNCMNLELTASEKDLIEARIFIVTVPTPIDKYKNPDLSFLRNSSITVGKTLKNIRLSNKNESFIPVVIYESTVYPGATEEVCIPLIEEYSGLKLGNGFFCGYSPERINPGDKLHDLKSIIKVTSGCCEESAAIINNLYSEIVEAGTYKASSIKVAEAAKVIENTQRDLNIALVNELAIIFSKVGINTLEVIETASTKWNFLKFYPGLVGGHCIGVDPYYLTYKSQQVGYNPQVILAGRRINDSIGEWMVQRLILKMCQLNININGAKVIVLGVSFKENCPDLRNTKVIDILDSLKKYKMDPTIVDPHCSKYEALKLYEIDVLKNIPIQEKYDAVILAVAHDEFKVMCTNEWKSLGKENSVFVDFKGLIPKDIESIAL